MEKITKTARFFTAFTSFARDVILACPESISDKILVSSSQTRLPRMTTAKLAATILLLLSLAAFLTIAPRSTSAANTSSLSWNGDDNRRVTVGLTPSLNLGDVMTLEAWIKPDIVSGVAQTIISHRSVNVTGAWQLDVFNTGGSTQALRVTSLNTTHALTANNAVADDTWQHVAYVRESSSGPQRIYVNGVALTLSTDTAVAFVDNGNPIWIGGSNVNKEFKGLIDEVRVWNVARRQEDIQRDMYRELNGTENGLVGYWKFEENTGCTAYDTSDNNNDGTLDPTCSSDSPVWSTDIPTLNNQGPDLPPGTVTNSRGGWLYSGRAVAASGMTINKLDYSVNGGGFMGATATDGAFSSNGENFEAFFQSTDNGNSYPGYVLSLRSTDSTEKSAKRTHFDPFNLSSVRKLADGQLEFVFNVNKQRTLMKDKLDRYKILYSGEGSSDKTLLDDIPIDFEAVRSRLQNQATNGISCDPCVYDNGKMTLSYLDNNSQLTVVTKKAPTLTGNTTFKVMAVSPDKFEQNSNSLTLESTSGEVRSASISLTAAGETGTKPEEEITIEEPGQKKLPGQKASFKETPLSGEAGPIAAIINGVISTILGILEKIRMISIN